MLVSVFSSVCAVSAQGLGSAFDNAKTVADKSGWKTADISAESMMGKIINVALSVVGALFLALMLYGGFLWMTAAGDGGKVDKAKEIIRAAIIGIIIVVSAYVITYFVVQLATGIGLTGK